MNLTRHAILMLAGLLLCAGLRTAPAETVHMKDGSIYTKVSNLRDVGSVFLFEYEGRMQSVAKRKIDRIVDDDGRIVFEAQTLSAKQIAGADGHAVYVFYRNGQELGRGRWSAESDGVFELTRGTVPDGVYKEYYDSGKLEKEFPFKNGLLHGICRTYYDTGKIAKEGTFLNGREEGISRLFYKSGQLKGESVFKNGLKDGETRLYHASGSLRGMLPFSKGQIHGKAMMYYPSGQLELEVEFKNGRKHGTMKKYYESGKIKLDATCKDDEFHGDVTSYYESGRVKKSKTFRNGKVLRK